MTCKKAQEFLERHAIPVKAVTDVGKEKHARAGALKLAKDACNVVIAKGKKIVSFDMRRDPPDDDTLAALLLGPTGNLRAPALRVGSSLYVGFSEDAFRNLIA